MYRKIKDYFRLFLYNIFMFIFFITPKFLMKKFLQFLASIAYKINKKHIRIAKANLDLVYENRISEERKEEIIKRKRDVFTMTINYQLLYQNAIMNSRTERELKSNMNGILTNVKVNNRTTGIDMNKLSALYSNKLVEMELVEKVKKVG